MGVVVIAYSMNEFVGGVHSMLTVELSLPFTTSTTLTSAGAGSEKGIKATDCMPDLQCD